MLRLCLTVIKSGCQTWEPYLLYLICQRLIIVLKPLRNAIYFLVFLLDTMVVLSVKSFQLHTKNLYEQLSLKKYATLLSTTI